MTRHRGRGRPAYRCGGIAATLAAAVFTAAGIAAQEVTYSGSLQYATGSYVFAERTHSAYLISGLGVEAGRFELRGSVPVIFQNSAVVTYVQGSPLPTGGPDHEAVRRREPGTTIPTHGRGGMGRGGGGMSFRPVLRTGEAGQQAQGTDSVAFADDFATNLGDPMLQGSVELFSGTGIVRSLRLSGGAKVPVADLDSGVGTGEWDYLTGASVALGASDLYLFGDLSWWWLGDLPDLELEDGLSYGAGVGHALFGGRGSVLATVSGAQASIATVEAPVTAGLSVGYTLEDGPSLSLGTAVGLTESSPDFSLFLGWTVGL